MVSTSVKENQILVTSGTNDIKIASGSTTPGATHWQVGSKDTIYVDVDTSAAGFTKIPVYVTSIGGIRQHESIIGGSSVYQTTAKGFRVYIRWDRISVNPEALTPENANENQWHINWIAFEPSITSPVKKNQISITCGTDDTKIASGSTIPGATNWAIYSPETVYVKVDTSAGFTNTPVYITSIGGSSQHGETTGSSSVYSPSNTQFSVYIKWDKISAAWQALTPQNANENQWHINWIAFEPSITRLVKENQISVTYGIDNTKIVSGSTAPGATNWQKYDTKTIYVDVDTSAADFTNTPVYVTSIAGILWHWTTTGGSSVYEATAKGFRVYIKWDSTSPIEQELTIQFAKDCQWHINWMALDPSTTKKTAFIDPKKYYRIINQKSDRCIDVKDYSTANGALLQQWDNLNGDNQQWQFQDAGSDYYYIVSKQSGKFISVMGGNTANEALLHQYEKAGDDQKWRLEDAGNGYFHIINKKSDKFISVMGGNTANEALLHQYEKAGNDQKWKFVESV